MSDASRALLLVEQMGFGLGGKKTDNSVILSKGYAKGKSAKPGPSVCHMGLLHSFLLGDSILETVWRYYSRRKAVGRRARDGPVGKDA